MTNQNHELDALSESKTVCPCCGELLEVSIHFPVEISEFGDTFIVYLECPIEKGTWKLELPIPIEAVLERFEKRIEPKGNP